jgi:hypothetical protein
MSAIGTNSCLVFMDRLLYLSPLLPALKTNVSAIAGNGALDHRCESQRSDSSSYAFMVMSFGPRSSSVARLEDSRRQ